MHSNVFFTSDGLLKNMNIGTGTNYIIGKILNPNLLHDVVYNMFLIFT
jgi:hypothetical protein